MLVGLSVALLPHLLWWLRTGSPDWIMNDDELVAYLPLGAHSYHNHPWKTGDPTMVSGGRTIFPWLQVIPGVTVARLLGLGPVGIAMAWRILGGLLLPAGLYWVARFAAPPWAATGISTVVMLDHGTLWGRLFEPHFRKWWHILRGQTLPFDGDPGLLLLWRVNPSITLPFLLAAVGTLLRARHRGTWSWIVGAGLLSGLLFHVMFYYWTCMAFALVLLWIVDAGHRRVHFHVGWIAAMVGLPAVLSGAQAKRELGTAWLQRFDMFVPVPRFDEFILHPVAFALIAACVAACWFRRRDLLPIALVAAAAALLCNHQILTGTQVENFHWMYVWGPCGVLILLVLAWAGLQAHFNSRRWPAYAAAGLVAFHGATGICLRVWDSLRPARMTGINADWRAYDAQRARPDAPALDNTSRLAGDVRFGIFAQIRDNGRGLVGSHYYSQRVDDAGLARLLALNAVLSGETEDGFIRSTHLRGRPQRDPDLWSAELYRYRRAYRDWAADPRAGMDEYKVRYLALRREAVQKDPPFGHWHLVQDGPSWRVWERTDAKPMGR